MLGIISDLHITDGTVGQLLPPATIDLLCERLCDLAWRASWRSDGCYRPVDRIDLVLLGDVLARKLPLGIIRACAGTAFTVLGVLVLLKVDFGLF